MSSSSTPDWLWRIDSQHRLLLALIISAIGWLVVPSSWHLFTRILFAWDTGIICLLLLIWSVILTAHPRQIRQRATTNDLNRLLVGILLVSAVCASLVAIIYILGNGQNLPPKILGLHITLCVVSIVGSWLLLHTVFTLRYAHYYYQPPSLTSTPDIAGGLDFPGDEPPDYLDFAYFALVIGMTYQVSDVAITSRLMRRVVLLHGLLSFWFYTVVFALSINILSSLISSNH